MASVDYEEVLVPNTDVKIKIPVTAEGWELYGTKPGANTAAREIARALKAAISVATKTEAVEIMSAVLRKYEKFGAMDTEPRWHVERLLGDARGGCYQWEI
jgi:hypothetical protein